MEVSQEFNTTTKTFSIGISGYPNTLKVYEKDRNVNGVPEQKIVWELRVRLYPFANIHDHVSILQQ
jgi:hypothetical protein